nr:phosphatase PAP2 family protein [uncultured Halomonas sp.]
MATPYSGNAKPLSPLVPAWLGFVLLMLFFQRHGIDFAVADRLFRWEGGDWSLKHHIVTESILHNGGRAVSEALGALAILGFAASLMGSPLRAWRRALGYLIAALAVSTVSVAILKQWVSMDCPWDLARYGGDMPFIGLFEQRPDGLPDAACFPAGHASAGYAWIALYFFFKATLPRWRWWGLTAGLSMGLAFGIAQQLRGAHFLSHDLWTLMICWTSSALLAHVLMSAPASSSRDASFLVTSSPTARPLQ